MASEKKRTRLSYETKLDILKKLSDGADSVDLMQEYRISSRTFSRIKRDKENIVSLCDNYETKHKKTNKTSEFPILEAAMSAWFYQHRELGHPISGPIIQAKALHFAKGIYPKFGASSGWLHRFRNRQGILSITTSGEILSNDEEGATTFKAYFSERIKKEKIPLENIYTADESGLNYKVSMKSIAEEAYTCQDRVTALFCCNASGSHKLPLTVIGKSLTPKLLRKITNLPVIYRASTKPWMDSLKFMEWFKDDFIPEVLDFQQESNKSGKIILLIDNAPAHCTLEELNNINDNVQVVFLPPNTTSILQPLDQGILALVKKIYKRSLLEKFYFQNDNQPKAIIDVIKRVELYDCIKMLSDAWDYVSGLTISNSWKNLLGDFITHFETVSQVVQSEEQICDNVVSVCNAVGFSEEAREKARSEVLEWLKFNDFDRGWEPMSDDQIIESVVKSFQNKSAEKEAQMKRKSLQKNSDVNSASTGFLLRHVKVLDEIIRILHNQTDVPEDVLQAANLVRDYVTSQLKHGAVDDENYLWRPSNACDWPMIFMLQKDSMT